MNVDGPVFTTGLIGGDIAHSLSPAMHNAAFAYHGLPDRYTLWPVGEADLAVRIAALRAPEMRGANVTIPHKAAVLPLLDEFGQDPDVRALQAANTIVRRDDGSLLGLNTDVAGFLEALRFAGFDTRGADVVMLGAGGAARAAAWGLAQAGVRSLTVGNRSAANARQLLTALPARSALAQSPRLAAVAPDDPQFEASIRDATLLVNATPIGADGHMSPVPATLLHQNLFVSDLIYRPTPLLRAAAERGARTQDGLEMLVQQGALAFEAWTGLPAPVDVMRAAAWHTRELAS